jgi:hypothetical protein
MLCYFSTNGGFFFDLSIQFIYIFFISSKMNGYKKCFKKGVFEIIEQSTTVIGLIKTKCQDVFKFNMKRHEIAKESIHYILVPKSESKNSPHVPIDKNSIESVTLRIFIQEQKKEAVYFDLNVDRWYLERNNILQFGLPAIIVDSILYDTIRHGKLRHKSYREHCIYLLDTLAR